MGGSEQRGLMEGAPASGRGLGTRPFKFLLTQAILWFCDEIPVRKPCKSPV